MYAFIRMSRPSLSRSLREPHTCQKAACTGQRSGRITAIPEVILKLKAMSGLATTRPETGLAGRPLFDALPQKLESRILSINHASFPVLAGDKEQPITALEFEPSDIIDAAPVGRPG
jgi:hypothetical protein